MLLSLALVFLCGMILGAVFQRLKLPSLLGMLITGILLGPYVLNLLDPSILNISADLRQMALIIILARAGLNLDIKDLKRVGRPAILMCFVPSCFEIVDDVFVIVLFTAFSGLAAGGSISPVQFLTIPTSIVSGLAVGIGAGLLLAVWFTNVHMRDSGKVILILSVAFLFVTAEQWWKGVMGFSGLLAVMAIGASLKQRKQEISRRLSGKFSKLWVGAEILLFVLVGATVDISYALKAGGAAVMLIFFALLFRVAGVFVSLVQTPLNKKERIFTAFAYLPKATVQAAIGGLPLAMGLACGQMVLTVAVLAILITAPLGAILIEGSYKKLLTK